MFSNLFLSYKPVNVDLMTKLRPFVPDYLPAVGDIDGFIKVGFAPHSVCTAVCSCLITEVSCYNVSAVGNDAGRETGRSTGDAWTDGGG